MPKLSLSTIGSRYASVAALNQNFDAIETAIENTLSRDGTTPNVMGANLDMNSHNLLNVGTINGADVTTIGDVQAAVDSATASATAAATSASNAASSASTASAAAANLPNATTAGADKYIQTNATADGFDYLTAAQVLSDIGAASTSHNHTGVYEPADATILKSASIGVSVQGYDVDTAKIDVAQTFTASQRGTVTTDNDGSFDLSATNNFFCTPTGNVTLTFTNHTAGQSGWVLFANTGGYTGHSVAATTKCASDFLTTLNATGTYLISYFDNGTNAYVVCSKALA